MITNDIPTILIWWLMLFLLGTSLLPIVTAVFSRFIDKGYIFSKILSIAVLSYLAFLFGTLHLVPFSRVSLIIILLLLYGICFFAQRKNLKRLFTLRFAALAAVEEIIFLSIMTLWTVIRGYNPEIHGLEKYMDFGFMNSILRAEFFPPKDMWLTPYSINYYYFGHFYSAVLTKLSGIPSHLTYNLILGTVAGLCFTAAFSIGMTLAAQHLTSLRRIKIVFAGLLSGLLITFAGNLHTIYTLFKPYENEHPVPPWQLEFSPATFPNAYWYPNATRFIYNTIHEFPIYSWVVADLHGHVLDIPFVLLTLAVLYTFFLNKQPGIYTTKFFRNGKLLLISFLLAVMYMTNAWDGLIYLLLTALIFFYFEWGRVMKNRSAKTTDNPLLHILPNKKYMSGLKKFLLQNWIVDLLTGLCVYLFVVGIGFVLFSLPFSVHFKPFVSGIGVLCAPAFLTKLGHIGPFLFEADHCQHSPWWQLLILYGFFAFFAVSLLLYLRNKQKTATDIFMLLLVFLSLILITVPEFIYAKDIYPAHYRANTMFKLVFQAFMLLSLVSAYGIFRIIPGIKNWPGKCVFLITTGILLTFVFIYPYFAVTSYYNNMQSYQGIDGTTYMKTLYPSDFAAIEWINSRVKGQPVILEAQSDSYTDFGRVSTNTGLPTVLGWTVHEWLWRGQYDYDPNDPRKESDSTPYYPAPRIGDVQTLYESTDFTQTKDLLRKYHVSYVFLGDLERQKYANINERKWNSLGKLVYQKGATKIYKVSP